MDAATRRRRVEQLTWVLIYGGLFLVVLGLATGALNVALGLALALPGGVAAAIGVLLIFVRARMKDGD